MGLFTPPESDYSNYYEQGAFNLTWRYNAFMLLMYNLLIIAGGLIDLNILLVGLMCWATPASSLLILKRTRKYELVAYGQVILGSIVTGWVLNMDFVNIHVVEVVFMMIIVFYAFVTLRRKVGAIALAIQFVWFVIYLFTDHHSEPEELTLPQNIALLLSLITALSLFGFLIAEFLKLRKTAENKYVSLNRDLNEINHLVNMQYQEKTVMLKEIHHRVKNNLQVISSLLRLQSYEIEEEASQMHFQDAIYRVSAMALIHEKMYQNENLSQINLKNYIETLAEDLVHTHARDVRIQLEVESDIQELGNDTLVPVALILNELITNSLKHAFSGMENGKIDVKIIRSDREDYFRFIYRDSGEWKTTTKNTSFGLELIATLTEQLDGKVTRGYDEGTKYEFILKDLK